MSTLLLFPPAADPAHPPLGIASLAGYLEDRREKVVLADLNVRAYNELLTAPYLERCARLLRRSLRAFESKPSLPVEYRARYRAAAHNLLSADYLIAHVDSAREQLRDRDTYATRQSYARAAGLLRRAMLLVSAAHYPAQWSAGGFSTSHDCTSTLAVLEAVHDRKQNLFLPFFEQIVPKLVAAQHRVIGISLNYYGQLIPAITLAAVVRKLSPEAFVVVGGGLVCFFEERWEVLSAFTEYIDAYVPFEGERPLFDLVKALGHGDDLNEVKGLVRFQNGKPLYRPAGSPLPAADFPVPDYDGLRLSEYLTPEPVLPLLSSRGCYWGRCAFCSHARLYRDQFRRLNANDVMRVAQRLHQKYAASCFYFVDEAIPPATAAAFAEMVVLSRLQFRWFGETRMEHSYTRERLKQLRDGGCLMLIFGLESAVPRVLNAMEKGITPKAASNILHDCAIVGIRSFVMFFSGFPSETLAEAERTVEFIEEHADCIMHVANSRFVLEEKAPVFRQCQRYGLSALPRNVEHDLQTWRTYHVDQGMQPAEISEFVSEMDRRNRVRPSESFLISRSHLVFLPQENQTAFQPVERGPVNLSRPEQVIPLRSDTLLACEFAFNLDQVQHALESPSDVVERNPTSYVFDQDHESLIEVGTDGVALLGVCSGGYTLAEILEAVGERGRETTLLFFNELTRRNFIEWKVTA
jgi:hypothetical protein